MPSPLRFISLALFLLTHEVGAASEESLPPAVKQALQNAQIPSQNVAVIVQALNEGKRSSQRNISHNAQAVMNPASVMKLVTTYTALNALGPTWRWTTSALAELPPTNGIIDGPLYLKGSGDPKFALEHLTALLRQLRVRGISHINGGLVLDRQAFNLPPFNPGTFDDLPMRPYNVGPDALLLNFRAITLNLVANDTGVSARLETPADGFSVHNQLSIGKGGCEDWKDLITPQLKGKSGEWQLGLSGSLNPKCGAKTLNLAPLADNDYAAALIKAIWKELGGEMAGPVRNGITPTNAVLLAENESPPLVDIVRDINKFSNNVMARQLFLSLSEKSPATLEDARARTREWLNINGLNLPELTIDNGSGLSRQERISADSLAKLLHHAWHSPVMPEFMSSLPIVGLDGTMRKRLKESKSTGRGHIKTGTLDGVKTISGYVLNQQGERFVVVFLINHPKASQGQAAMDVLLKWVIEGKN